MDEHIKGMDLYKDEPCSPTRESAGASTQKTQGCGVPKKESASSTRENQALSYLMRPDLPRHAEVMTSTTDGTNLDLFVHYAAPSEVNSTH